MEFCAQNGNSALKNGYSVEISPMPWKVSFAMINFHANQAITIAAVLKSKFHTNHDRRIAESWMD